MVVDEVHHVMVENAPCVGYSPAYTPKPDWWIVLLYFDSVATVLPSTVSRLQGLITILSQQEAELKQLCTSLSEICKIDGSILSEQVATIDLTTTLS